ncbi:sensor histidine kinase [Actinoplanes derwentensis]|uniref:histidine kinase n=1 Tax=Actinoplanes derwentensis TaxID=113562 RepID=A0A1H1VFM0_9ACTN|nr:histidine kinase [Actinoplanes derwentensis]GID83710.1 two-component sensor histidine kinase [Actinoplanes derwentensis]SDS83598.1 Signal transduction histidine kinase [Actinoplanes derwentensis]
MGRRELLLLWDLIIVTVVATIALQYRSSSLWDVLIGLTMAAALVARRFAPVRVFAVVSALGLLQVVVASAVPAGYDLAVLVAMAAVVTHARSARAGYLSLVVVAISVLFGTVLRIDDSWEGSAVTYPYLADSGAVLGACGALWLIAYVMRGNRDRVAIAERERDHLARLAAADERAFIARELHDVVAHSLAVMIAQADGASYVAGTDTERAREAMRTVAGTGREALADMHRIVAVLRGTGDDTEPDRRRLGIDQLDSIVDGARAAGLGVDLRIDGDTGQLSPAVELTVFRIVQESLTNVLRHAGTGTKVTVDLGLAEDRVTLEVTDDGTGRTGAGGVGGGNGLTGMRERVAVHHGKFSAGPRPGSGWSVRAMIPR